MPQTSSWRPGISNWTTVAGVRDYFNNYGTNVALTSSNIKNVVWKGCPLYIKNSSNSHIVICTGYASDGWPYLNGHTNDRYHQRVPTGYYTNTIQLTPYKDYEPTKYYNPEGNVDVVSSGINSVYIKGWAFDRDDVSQPVGIHVYIGDRCCAAFMADAYRSDVNTAYGVGDYHGFEREISVSETGEQRIRIFAINIGDGSNVQIVDSTIPITKFTTNIYDGIVVQGNSYPICGTFKNAGTYPWLELFVDYGYVSTTCNNEYNNYAFYLDTTKYSDGNPIVGISLRNQDGLSYANWYNVIINNIHTVSFDAIDEHISLESKNVTWGQTYGELPTPIRTGYKFVGWFTDSESGEQITSDTTVTTNKDQTLYAHWEKCETETIVTDYGAYKLCEITGQNIDGTCIVTIAGYRNNALVNIQKREYSENLKPFVIIDDIDEVKVMIWDSLCGMKPITQAETISSSKFIIE